MKWYRLAHALYGRRCVARKHHAACFGACGVISPGEAHLMIVAFPGHDANGSDRPWRMRQCPRHSLERHPDVIGYVPVESIRNP